MVFNQQKSSFEITLTLMTVCIHFLRTLFSWQDQPRETHIWEKHVKCTLFIRTFNFEIRNGCRNKGRDLVVESHFAFKYQKKSRFSFFKARLPFEWVVFALLIGPCHVPRFAILTIQPFAMLYIRFQLFCYHDRAEDWYVTHRMEEDCLGLCNLIRKRALFIEVGVILISTRQLCKTLKDFFQFQR